MRVLLLLLTLLISACADRSDSGSLNFKKFNTSGESDDEEGGLSSSGGGEFILDRHNPWFMDKADAEVWRKNEHKKQAVKYCINHDKKLFSLPKTQAKAIVQDVIQNFSKQLINFQEVRAPWNDNLNFNDPMAIKLFSDRHLAWECHTGACPLLISETDEFTNYGDMLGELLGADLSQYKFYKAQLATNYVSTENCKEADIEIILGNYNSPQIKKLRKQIGYVQFRHMAGVAIKTEYDYATLRSKGFIYIAADKGKYSYAGPRNVNMGGEGDIWDFDSTYPLNAKVIEASQFQYYEDPLGFNLRQHFQGPFKSVFAHEFAHTLGVIHTPKRHDDARFVIQEDLMGVNTPANLISAGMVSNSRVNFMLDIFDRALLPMYRKPVQMKFARYTELEGNSNVHWEFENQDMLRHAYEDAAEDGDLPADAPEIELEPRLETLGDYLKLNLPTLNKYFFLETPKYGEAYINSPMFVFEFGDDDHRNENYIKLMSFETQPDQTFKPKVLKNYRIWQHRACAPSTVRSKISFKSLYSNSGYKYKLVMDPNSGIWNKVESNNEDPVAIPYEEGLISFRDTNLCGEIIIEDGTRITFNLLVSHIGKSQLTLIDPETNYRYTEELKTLDFSFNPTELKLEYIDYL